MRTDTNRRNISYAPTDPTDLYPDTDGEPMAASDYHLEILIWLILSLRAHFADMLDTYVFGDILTYYTEGNPRDVVAPDVLVSFGIGQKKRHTYKVWEEGKVPDFVMEFSSKTTYQKDLTDKKGLYARLGIPNYVLYDAEALYQQKSNASENNLHTYKHPAQENRDIPVTLIAVTPSFGDTRSI